MPGGKGKGLLMLLGQSKGSAPEEEAEEPMGATEDVYVDEFISAIKDDDPEGARAAFKSAVRACMSAKESGTYDEE